MNALEPLFPVLRTLEPVGLPSAALQGWYAYANQRQAARLAKHLDGEFRVVSGQLAHRVDHTYLRSDAFQANVVQAVRAAEVAESEGKLRFIARALAGCTLAFPSPQVDKVQTMRVIEALSERELNVLAGMLDALDPIDPYSDVVPERGPVLGLSREEGRAGVLGLQQLGLLAARPEQGGPGGWQLTPLARQVIEVTRLHLDGEFSGGVGAGRFP